MSEWNKLRLYLCTRNCGEPLLSCTILHFFPIPQLHFPTPLHNRGEQKKTNRATIMLHNTTIGFYLIMALPIFLQSLTWFHPWYQSLWFKKSPGRQCCGFGSCWWAKSSCWSSEWTVKTLYAMMVAQLDMPRAYILGHYHHHVFAVWPFLSLRRLPHSFLST